MFVFAAHMPDRCQRQPGITSVSLLFILRLLYGRLPQIRQADLGHEVRTDQRRLFYRLI
jgi:hypothetical protein